MMNQLCIGSLTEVVGGQLNMGSMPPLGGIHEPVRRIVTDSRLVEVGDVFWALAGTRQHGGHFALEALAKGAAGVVTDLGPVEPWGGTFCLHVDDSRHALAQLARWARFRYDGTAVGVAGAANRPIACSLIEHLIGSAPRSASRSLHDLPATRRSCDLSLKLIQLPACAPVGVFSLENTVFDRIEANSHLCQPHILVITSTHESHQPGLTSEEARSLLCEVPDDGYAILNGDDPGLLRLARDCPRRTIWVGRGGHCDLTAREVFQGHGELSFWLDNQLIRVPLWGRHHVTSVLAAMAVAKVLGHEPRHSAELLESFTAPAGCCRVIRSEEALIIEDTCNSSSLSLQDSLEVLREIDTSGRRIVVCGDLEDWDNETSEETMHNLGDRLACSGAADLLVLCGKFARAIAAGANHGGLATDRIIVTESVEAAAERLMEVRVSDDAVLVCGSHRPGEHPDMHDLAGYLRKSRTKMAA